MTLAWIPNSLTMGNLLFGFISVVFSSQGNYIGYVTGGVLILGAALLDGLDGPVARALNVQSLLGKELDSLADCVTFGIAPGYLAYKAYLSGIIVPIFGAPIDFGIFIASIFPICAAYRLARFNVCSDVSSFVGLPSPIAGMIIAMLPFYFKDIVVPKVWFSLLYAVVAILMVSTVKYSKPQSTLFKNIHGIKLVVFIIAVILLVLFFKKWTIFIFISLYLLSGILSFIIQFIQEHKY